MMRWARLVWIVVLAAPVPGAPGSLDQVLERLYEARGGLSALKSIESARISGIYHLTGMPEEPVLLEWKRPDKVRLTIGVPGKETVEGFDGETAWVIRPASPFAERPSGTEAARIRLQADLMDGPFVDWQAKGHAVTYLGEGELDGAAVRKLGLIEEDGFESTVMLDGKSFLPVRRRGSVELQGARTEVEIFFEDYKKVDGLMIAHTIRTELIDFGLTQSFRIEALETNVDIPDDRFSRPGP